MQRHRIPARALAVVAGVAFLGVAALSPASAETAVDAGAGADVGAITGPAESTLVADRPPQPVPADVVSISRVGDVDAALFDRVREAAESVGAQVALGRSTQAQVMAVRRGTVAVQAIPSGWAVPFSLTILPVDVVEELMGPEVATGIARRGRVAMADSSAQLRGAEIGDRLDVRDASGGVRSFVVAVVVPDDVLGGTELVMSDTSAAVLGLSLAGRVVIHDIPSRDELDAALDDRGLVDSEEIDVLQPSSERLRIRRSWRPFDPDTTLGLLETKLLLGEFAFVPRSNGAVSIEQEWIDENVGCDATRPVYYCRALIHPSIPVRARCHDEVMGALRSAFDEIARKGLGSRIDVANANSYGGCFNPRFNRLSTHPFLGSLSRHAWAMALDTNTTTNAQGYVPRLDCRVVRIFRKWGFSWGGNYLTPDGMHLEWVASPRHRLAYPSKYCPNVVRARSGRVASMAATMAASIARTRATFFAQDGWGDEHGG